MWSRRDGYGWSHRNMIKIRVVERTREKKMRQKNCIIFRWNYCKSFVSRNEYRIRTTAGQHIVQAILLDVPDKLMGSEFLSSFQHVHWRFYWKFVDIFTTVFIAKFVNIVIYNCVHHYLIYICIFKIILLRTEKD